METPVADFYSNPSRCKAHGSVRDVLLPYSRHFELKVVRKVDNKDWGKRLPIAKSPMPDGRLWANVLVNTTWVVAIEFLSECSEK
jgi:hypothetical protein